MRVAGVQRLALFMALTILNVQDANSAAPTPTGSGESLYTRIGDAPLGAKTSRFDYQSYDPIASRLTIAEMGSGKLLVFDTRSQTLVASLDGFPRITGVLAVPALHKIYASVPGAGIAASASVALGMAGLSSGSGKLAILNDVSLKEIARLPVGVFPDGIAYDQDDQKIFVSDELGRAVVVVDAVGDRVIARIETESEVGNVQYDPITKRVYAPLQSRNELAVIDPRQNRLIERIPLPGAKHPHALRIAEGAAIGYVACDENDRLLTVDLANGKILAADAIGHDPDVLAADPQLKRLYVASESGTLSTFDISNPARAKKLGDEFIGEDAHSVAADPRTHRVFLPLRDAGGMAVLRMLQPRSE
jgi:DNA-binding beta-propeller fold protein YncE